MQGRVWGIKAVGVAVGMLGLVGLNGCGLRAELTANPTSVTTGQNVDFTVKLTNPSVCPVADVQAFVLPFFRLDDIDVTGAPETVQLIFDILSASCSGAPFELPNGIECNISGGTIVCEDTGMATGPDVFGDATLTSKQGLQINCQRAGSRLTCQLPAIEGLGAALATASTSGLACVPSFPGAACSNGGGQVGPGQSISGTVSLPAPLTSGSVQNFVFAGASKTGVCKAGTTNANLACNSSADCQAASMNTCGTGICQNGPTPGAGCDNDGECGSGGTCPQCRTDVGMMMAPVPFACANLFIFGATAPVVSPAGLLALVVALGSVGVLVVGARRGRV